ARPEDGVDPDSEAILGLVRDCDDLNKIAHDMVVQTRLFLEALVDRDVRLPSHLGTDTSGDEDLVDEVSLDWPGATMGIWRLGGGFVLHWTDGKIEKTFALPGDRKIAVDWVSEWCEARNLYG